MSARYRLAAVTSHPVQYQAPLFQRLAAHGGIELTVFYGDDRSLAGEIDDGFGRPVQWDRPLLDGYRAVFLRRCARAAGPLRRLAADAAIVRHLWQGRFDAVFVHSYATRVSLLAMVGALLRGTPILLRTESERLRPRPAWIELLKWIALRPLLAAAAGVLVIGGANRRFYDYYGVPRNRQFFTPYSVDSDFFLAERRRTAPSRPERRLAHGWTEDVTVVGFSGKLIPLKRVGDVIDAVGSLQAEGRRVGLMIVGDGPSREELEQHARRRGLRWTQFVGFKNQSDLAGCYVCMDALVLPSQSETWGLVLNEAMLFGLPVVASSMVGASEDLVEPGGKGKVGNVGDVEGLAAALRPLVESAETRRRCGRRSEDIVRRYTLDTCVRGILDGLDSVTGRRSADHAVPARDATTP